VPLEKTSAIQRVRQWAAQEDLDRALQECSELLKDLPDDPEIYVCLGELFFRRQSVPQALDAYQQAAHLFAQGDAMVEAVSCYKHMLQIAPSRAETWIRLGDTQARRGYFNNAVADYLSGAKLYLQDEAAASALDSYQKVLKLRPGNRSARLRVAELCLAEGLTVEGVEVYRAVAYEHERAQEFDEAQRIYTLMLAYAPSDPEARHRLGIAQTASPAAETFVLSESSAESHRDNSVIEGSRIDTSDNGDLVELKLEIDLQQEDAPESLSEAIALPEESDLPKELEEQLETYYQLALAYKEMGLLDEAIETFESVVRSPSLGVDACTLMAACYEDRNLNKPAIAWLERARRYPGCDGPLGLAVKHTLAQLYEEAGLAEKAAGLYESIPGMRELAERLRRETTP
jgi:tetratricopeptide (TPR) repeat protein